MGKINEKVLILKNKEEADRVHKNLLRLMERLSVFYRSIHELNENMPYMNIWWDEYDKKFHIQYLQEYFNYIQYGTSVTIYKPEWAVLHFDIKHLKSYDYDFIDGHTYSNYIEKAKDVIFEIRHLEGKFVYVKDKKNRNSLHFRTLLINNSQQVYEIEKLIDFFSSGDKIVYDFSFLVKNEDIFYKNEGRECFVSINRLLQAGHAKFNVEIHLHILYLHDFIRDIYALQIVSNYIRWNKDVLTLYLDTNMKGLKEWISEFSRFNYVIYEGPRRLSFESASSMVRSSLDCSFKVTHVDNANHVVYAETRNGISFKFCCNCRRENA